MGGNYVVSVRKPEEHGDKFGDDVNSKTLFLKVPDSSNTSRPSHAEPNASKWVDEVVASATTGVNPHTKKDSGDILVFVHGYANGADDVIDRHKKIKKHLKKAGYTGVVVSYDWPSSENVLLYLPDRRKAKATAERLTDDCIKMFSERQRKGCELNVHLLGHSTGVYVIREAFTNADEISDIKNFPWKVSQIAFISGDISSRSMDIDKCKTKSLYRHCVRLTNYQNHYDNVLKLSNTKRIGLAQRVGRAGLPEDSPASAVNINTSAYYEKYHDKLLDFTESHSWYFDDEFFAKDLYYTLAGNIGRGSIPTRERDRHDGLIFKS